MQGPGTFIPRATCSPSRNGNEKNDIATLLKIFLRFQFSTNYKLIEATAKPEMKGTSETQIVVKELSPVPTKLHYSK